MFYWYNSALIKMNSTVDVFTLKSLKVLTVLTNLSCINYKFELLLNANYPFWVKIKHSKFNTQDFCKYCLYFGHCNCNLILVNCYFSFINPVANYCQVTKDPNLALNKKMWVHFQCHFSSSFLKFLKGTRSRPHT